jgi:hypothetical protein
MDAKRVPDLLNQCHDLKAENERVCADLETMRMNYYRDLQVFKVHDT